MPNLKAHTRAQFDALLAFLPEFERPGRAFVLAWKGGEEMDAGGKHVEYPEYSSDVERFFHTFGKDGWSVADYRSGGPEALMSSPAKLTTASLHEVRAVLTWCSRGERFCDGYWEGCLERGIVQAALRRLAHLRP